MEKYKNLSGISPILSFILFPSGMTIRFKNKDGTMWDYTYDARSPGLGHINQMEHLAKMGLGLTRYIQKHVGNRFVKKQRVSTL